MTPMGHKGVEGRLRELAGRISPTPQAGSIPRLWPRGYCVPLEPQRAVPRNKLRGVEADNLINTACKGNFVALWLYEIEIIANDGTIHSMKVTVVGILQVDFIAILKSMLL